MLWNHRKQHPDILVWSDASGSWGYGALTQGKWFQHQWLPQSDNLSIAAKELIPVVLAAAAWSHSWQGKIICFNSDNEAVVAGLNATYSRDPIIAHLLWCLCLYAAVFTFWFCAAHIPGRLNSAADALSQNKMSKFFALFPQEQFEEATPLIPGLPSSGDLDVATLDRAVQEYFREALATSTKRSYASACTKEIPVVLCKGKANPAPSYRGPTQPLCRFPAIRGTGPHDHKVVSISSAADPNRPGNAGSLSGINAEAGTGDKRDQGQAGKTGSETAEKASYHPYHSAQDTVGMGSKCWGASR